VARGWESKSVEEQQAEAEEHSSKRKPPLTAEQLAKRHARDGLLLNRSRIVQRLKGAQSPQHQRMLESALADLDARISQLG
jgi:hypothetical protein